jgi:hypothetical protein
MHALPGSGLCFGLHCWVYLSAVPFEKLGFNALPDKPMPKLAETIRHSLFAYMWSPIVLFGMLGGVMWASKDKSDRAGSSAGSATYPT